MNVYLHTDARNINEVILLAELDQVTDAAEKTDDGIVLRRVSGQICRPGLTRRSLLSLRRWAAEEPYVEDGRIYFPIRGLRVGHDHYPGLSWISVTGDALHLLLDEPFAGTIKEYAEQFQERNRRVGAFLDRWDNNRVTRNEYRELMGDRPLGLPGMDDPIPPDALAQIRTRIINSPEWRKASANRIH
jgi:hypothetical protein